MSARPGGGTQDEAPRVPAGRVGAGARSGKRTGRKLAATGSGADTRIHGRSVRRGGVPSPGSLAGRISGQRRRGAGRGRPKAAGTCGAAPSIQGRAWVDAGKIRKESGQASGAAAERQAVGRPLRPGDDRRSGRSREARTNPPPARKAADRIRTTGNRATAVGVPVAGGLSPGRVTRGRGAVGSRRSPHGPTNTRKSWNPPIRPDTPHRRTAPGRKIHRGVPIRARWRPGLSGRRGGPGLPGPGDRPVAA